MAIQNHLLTIYGHSTPEALLRADLSALEALHIHQLLSPSRANGTAAIFADDEMTFTFSMHGALNYPFSKEVSSLDVELPDGADDVLYLQKLDQHLTTAVTSARADIAFYLAGVDTVRGDRYGRLALSREGVHNRDRMVLNVAKIQDIPIALVMSG